MSRLNPFLGRCLVAGLLIFGAPRLSLAGFAAEPKPATSTNAVAATTEGKALFDGKTLKGWKITDFAGHDEVTVDPKFKPEAKAPASPAMILGMGAVLTGVTWTNPPPTGEYEVSLEAMKLEGSDFFCALTFPAADGHCSLILGGWGGGVVGLSSVDGMDASENETTKFRAFDKNHWYAVRVRVTKNKIQAWLDDEKIVDLVTTDRKIAVRPGEIELAQPFGISAYQTKAALRNIRLRTL
jgi:hypothetical protein